MSKLKQHDIVIRQQLEAGLSVAAIARSLGVPSSTLKSYLGPTGRYTQGKPLPLGKLIIRPHEEISETELLASELADLKRGLNKERRGEVAQERILRAVEQAVGAVSPRGSQCNFAPVLAEEHTTDDAHHRQVVLLSDFHGGEYVDSSAVNGLGAYSWDIMEWRIDQLVNSLASHRKHSPALTGLDIGWLGDMCGGAGHQELAETNEYARAEQAVKMGYLLGTLTERLAPYYRDIRCFGVVGNHGRLAIKPAAKRVHDNLDWISYVVAREYLKNYGHITVDVPTSGAMFWTVAGRTYYVFHGDGVRSSMPGVPWGGVMRRVNEIRRSHAQRTIDGFWLGHFHQAVALFDLGIFVNGSLKGTDEWSLKNFGSATRPTQLLLTFDEQRERLVDTKLLTPTAGLPSLEGE